MFNEGDRVRVITSKRVDFGMSGVVISYAGITSGEVQSRAEAEDITLGREDRLYEEPETIDGRSLASGREGF